MGAVRGIPVIDEDSTQDEHGVWHPEKYHFRGFRNGEKSPPDYAVWPPYQPGDVLYVRETWAQVNESIGMGLKKKKYIYRANYSDIEAEGWKWRPSIHMPRKAARIFLRVTGVRVERLQEITIAGLQQEGILPDGYISQYTAMTEGDKWFGQWKLLWDSTIKPTDREKYGWQADPWVWVIEFERISREEAGAMP